MLPFILTAILAVLKDRITTNTAKDLIGFYLQFMDQSSLHSVKQNESSHGQWMVLQCENKEIEQWRKKRWWVNIGLLHVRFLNGLKQRVLPESSARALTLETQQIRSSHLSRILNRKGNGETYEGNFNEHLHWEYRAPMSLALSSRGWPWLWGEWEQGCITKGFLQLPKQVSLIRYGLVHQNLRNGGAGSWR